MFERKIKLTEKELNKKINASFMEGYNLGYRTGREDALINNYSVNRLRELVCLKPIDKTE